MKATMRNTPKQKEKGKKGREDGKPPAKKKQKKDHGRESHDIHESDANVDEMLDKILRDRAKINQVAGELIFTDKELKAIGATNLQYLSYCYPLGLSMVVQEELRAALLDAEVYFYAVSGQHSAYAQNVLQGLVEVPEAVKDNNKMRWSRILDGKAKIVDLCKISHVGNEQNVLSHFESSFIELMIQARNQWVHSGSPDPSSQGSKPTRNYEGFVEIATLTLQRGSLREIKEILLAPDDVWDLFLKVANGWIECKLAHPSGKSDQLMLPKAGDDQYRETMEELEMNRRKMKGNCDKFEKEITRKELSKDYNVTKKFLKEVLSLLSEKDVAELKRNVKWKGVPTVLENKLLALYREATKEKFSKRKVPYSIVETCGDLTSSKLPVDISAPELVFADLTSSPDWNQATFEDAITELKASFKKFESIGPKITFCCYIGFYEPENAKEKTKHPVIGQIFLKVVVLITAEGKEFLNCPVEKKINLSCRKVSLGSDYYMRDAEGDSEGQKEAWILKHAPTWHMVEGNGLPTKGRVQIYSKRPDDVELMISNWSSRGGVIIDIFSGGVVLRAALKASREVVAFSRSPQESTFLKEFVKLLRAYCKYTDSWVVAYRVAIKQAKVLKKKRKEDQKRVKTPAGCSGDEQGSGEQEEGNFSEGKPENLNEDPMAEITSKDRGMSETPSDKHDIPSVNENGPAMDTGEDEEQGSGEQEEEGNFSEGKPENLNEDPMVETTSKDRGMSETRSDKHDIPSVNENGPDMDTREDEYPIAYGSEKDAEGKDKDLVEENTEVKIENVSLEIGHGNNNASEEDEVNSEQVSVQNVATDTSQIQVYPEGKVEEVVEEETIEHLVI
ncbi:hypothetical protein R1sor_013425 [Riccia sorocarpa]|uniref:Uncharacterized protein n=1 Tax=Riccia sorocarpa TaxID=122646 RepID=A0ABD3HAM3_9MARC